MLALGDPASSQPGLPGAILRDHVGAAVLNDSAELQLCPGAEPGFKEIQGRGCAPPCSSLQMAAGKPCMTARTKDDCKVHSNFLFFKVSMICS